VRFPYPVDPVRSYYSSVRVSRYNENKIGNHAAIAVRPRQLLNFEFSIQIGKRRMKFWGKRGAITEKITGDQHAANAPPRQRNFFDSHAQWVYRWQESFWVCAHTHRFTRCH
jgi:hypothetical protein